MQKIQSLYLLIGTNPLSNYVVADYFLNADPNIREIHFIHSAEDLENGIQSTALFAENLKSILRKRFSRVGYFLHPIHIKDSFSIHRDVRKIIANAPKTGVHLDYSGGTKEMVLHSYEAFKEVFDGSVTFSYFDTRRNLLKADSGSEDSTDSVFLGDKAEIGFDDLFALHGYRRVPLKNSGSVFSVSFFEDFLDLIRQPGNFCAYLEWQEHFYSVYPDFRRVLPADSMTEVSDLLPPDSPISKELEKTLFLKIHEDMPEYSLLEERDGRLVLRTDVSNKQMDKLIETRKYITGHWFEQYVYAVLRAYLSDIGTAASIDLNLLIQTNKKNFEIDVALIKGYEFCGISCTTDKTQSLCKSKGFEILHRTKQLAGDNSKAILMTFMNESSTRELDADLSDILEDRLLVLGLNDLLPAEEFCRKTIDFLSK